jgi:glycosyltransferase involved in cell wall biosynthesis
MDAHVDLVGYQADPFPWLLKAHALLMCSRHEAMGRATVEAMACGLPVIGHASGGTPELIEAGVAGLLYEGGAGPLADRMVQLASDRAQARTMGLAAQASSAARFSVERGCAEVYSVYRAVLQGR